MASNGIDNLIPTTKRTKAEAREISRKGGVASGKARKKKKLLKECLEALLEEKYKDDDGQSFTGSEAISLKLFEKAMTGDIKAFETIRDTIGQKPVDKVVVSEIEQTDIDEIRDLIDE